MPSTPAGLCPKCKSRNASKDHCPEEKRKQNLCRWRDCACGWTYDPKTGHAYPRVGTPSDNLSPKDQK